MKKHAKVLVALLTAAMVFCLAACGKTAEGSIDETAANRTEREQSQYTVIDDDAIALAATATSAANVLQAAQDALALVNQQRVAAGLTELVWSDGLAQAAQVRATEASQVFSHTRPNGFDWWTVNSDLMYGENLAEGYTTAQDCVAAWMASPTHRANVLNGTYVTCGIAIFQASNGTWYWAQEFGY